MTFRCPRGHESTDPDYCSVCGIAIPATAASMGASASPAPAVNTVSGGSTTTATAAPANANVCPVCGTPRTDPSLRYCEVCRYDFQTGTPSPTSGDPAVTAPPAASPPAAAHPPSSGGLDDPNDPFAAEFAALEAAAAQGSGNTGAVTAPPASTAAPVAPPGNSSAAPIPPSVPAAPTGPLWEARVAVDGSLDTDPDPALPAPTDEPDYFYPLTESEILIGRRDDRQGIRPQIPLRDPGVSRRHAMIRHDADGLSVMDLGSTNGTLVNGAELPSNSRRMLKDGDEITVGRWTRLTIRGDGT